MLMNIYDYIEQERQKRQANMGALSQAIDNNVYSGMANNPNQQTFSNAFSDYMNNAQTQSAQQAQDTQKNGQSIGDKAGKVAQGFMQGGLVGGIIAAAKAARDSGKNALRNAKALGKQTIKDTEQQNQALLNDNTVEANQMQLDNIVNNSYAGLPTGAAAPVQQPINYSNNADIAAYQKALESQGLAPEVINGVPQGLNSSNKDIAAWIDQYNTGAGRNNPIRIPKTEEEIAAARAGNFNVEPQPQQTKQTGLAGGINDLINGYIENRNTAFNPQNLKANPDKGIMTRIGEGLGTVARVANNPYLQGLVAMGASAAMGNPFAVAQGYKFANQRAMSNAYQDYLKQMYPDMNINPGVFGNITSADMNNMGKMAENQVWHEYLNKKNERDLDIKQQNADSREQDAQTRAEKQKNGTVITHVSTGGSKPTKSGGGNKPKTNTPSGYVIGQTPSGSRVKVPASQVKEFKSMGGKIVG